MASPPRSALFRAIVLTGASLAGACGKEAMTLVPDGTATDGGGAGADDGGGDAVSVDASCPDGSERPLPPCYYIR
jgi:hypothetical protein